MSILAAYSVVFFVSLLLTAAIHLPREGSDPAKVVTTFISSAIVLVAVCELLALRFDAFPHLVSSFFEPLI